MNGLCHPSHIERDRDYDLSNNKSKISEQDRMDTTQSSIVRVFYYKVACATAPFSQ